MSEKKKNTLPGAGARVISALLALILTGCLFLTAVSLIGLQVMTSSGLHERVALSRDVVDLQMSRVEEEITELAESYGFRTETLMSLITREQVEQLDREIVRWWTGAAGTGRLEEEPSFDLAGAEEALQADADFRAGLDDQMVKTTIDQVVSKAQEAIRKSAVQFRDMLLQIGVRMAGERINLPQAITLLGKVPLIAGLASLLLAGLIALLMSRRIQTSGQFIGGALSAAGLLMIFAWALLKMLDLRGIIAEASLALETQYAHLARLMSLEILGIAAGLLILGGLGMLLARKEYGRHGE